MNADAIYVRGLCLYYEDNVDKAFTHFQQVYYLVHFIISTHVLLDRPAAVFSFLFRLCLKTLVPRLAQLVNYEPTYLDCRS